MDGKELVERLTVAKRHHGAYVSDTLALEGQKALDAAIAYITGQDGAREKVLDGSWRAWTVEPPRATTTVEVMRRDWDSPLVWNVDALNPTCNVAGLYWRPVPQTKPAEALPPQNVEPEYVGWTCGKCGAPVAGGFSKCDKCGRDPKAAPMTEAACEQGKECADTEHDWYQCQCGTYLCRKCPAWSSGVAPTKPAEAQVEEPLDIWTHRKFSLEPGNPTHASVSIQDLKEFAAELDRRLSQPATK